MQLPEEELLEEEPVGEQQQPLGLWVKGKAQEQLADGRKPVVLLGQPAAVLQVIPVRHVPLQQTPEQVAGLQPLEPPEEPLEVEVGPQQHAPTVVAGDGQDNVGFGLGAPP